MKSQENYSQQSSTSYKECIVCFVKVTTPFILQCNHYICHECIKRQVRMKMLSQHQNQNQNSHGKQNQKMIIKCQVKGCNGVTLLQEQEIINLKNSNVYSEIQKSRTLSLKAYRDLSATQVKNRTIFCITCNQLLGLQEFLQSYHRNHEVQPLDKCFPQMQKNLAQTCENLTKMKQSIYSSQVFLTHQKKKLNDQYNNNLMKIKIMFDNLKEAVFLKQKLATQQYQIYMIDLFGQIDKKVKNVSQKMEECQKYEEWIESNLEVTSLTSQSKEIIRCANFYVDNYTNINKFLSACQMQKNSKSRFNSNSNNSQDEFLKISITSQNIKKIVEQVKICQIIITLQKDQKLNMPSSKINQNRIDQHYFSKKKKQIIDPVKNNKNDQSFVSTFSSNGLSKVKSITNFTNLMNGKKSQNLNTTNKMSIQDKIKQLRSTIRKQNSQNNFHSRSIIFTQFN